MSNVNIQSLTFRPGSHPKLVHLVIGDADDSETAEVWIEARFPFQGRSDHKLAVLAQDALDQLQTLIAQGKKAAQVPPAGTA